MSPPRSPDRAPDNELWLRVQQAAVDSQKIIPGAVAVGGTAAALYAGHRLSVDTDHLLANLSSRFDEVLEQLDAVPQWSTYRVQPPVLILGSLEGVEIGFRQTRRSLPIDTVLKETSAGKLCVPTLDELIGMKAFLAYSRRATRDFLDFAALSALSEPMEVLATLLHSQQRYGELQRGSVALEIAKTLSNPEPFDLDGVDLGIYKGIQPPWNHWDRVASQCRMHGTKFAEAIIRSSE